MEKNTSDCTVFIAAMCLNFPGDASGSYPPFQTTKQVVSFGKLFILLVLEVQFFATILFYIEVQKLFRGREMARVKDIKHKLGNPGSVSRTRSAEWFSMLCACTACAHSIPVIYIHIHTYNNSFKNSRPQFRLGKRLSHESTCYEIMEFWVWSSEAQWKAGSGSTDLQSSHRGVGDRWVPWACEPGSSRPTNERLTEKGSRQLWRNLSECTHARMRTQTKLSPDYLF